VSCHWAPLIKLTAAEKDECATARGGFDIVRVTAPKNPRGAGCGCAKRMHCVASQSTEAFVTEKAVHLLEMSRQP
jgi:hypothetical protein